MNAKKIEVGEYYISSTFEVVQYKGCGNVQSAMVGKGKNYKDALRILKERNENLDLLKKSK